MIERPNICGKAINQLMLMSIAFCETEAESLLRDWVSRSALTTHEKGNRRFGSFVLKIGQEGLENVFLDGEHGTYCSMCYGTETVKVFDSGQGSTTIPCQECKGVENERQDAISTRYATH